ncbi:hypothetical protein BKA57DRAFT_120637 [Linnemannia elongata]|nr:hypothetical protein BKA57DRAFT_120637 [Linnemannia elongata]
MCTCHGKYKSRFSRQKLLFSFSFSFLHSSLAPLLGTRLYRRLYRLDPAPWLWDTCGVIGEGAARDRRPSSPEPTEMNGCESTRTPPPHIRLYRFWTPLPGYGTPVMCEGAARDRHPSSP